VTEPVTEPAPPPPIPAATVVILRDGPSGLETLLLQRDSRLEFAGGMWVFPGGRIDAGDHDPDRPQDIEVAARRAAVREAREEAGIDLDPASLVWFSHWTPPPITPKRFATWFFAAPAPRPDVEVVVDGGEIRGFAWVAPAVALERRNAREIELAPPTWITLEHLAAHPTAGAALGALRSRPPEHFATRFAVVEGGAVALYHGDAAYDDLDPARPGPRHRLWMLDDGWRYERHG
jgi:8-oxo-dGTP pyrophosphatase MutT (NUDIX family)